MKLTIHKKIWIAISIMAFALSSVLNLIIYKASKQEALAHAEIQIVQTLKSNAAIIAKNIEDNKYQLNENAVDLHTILKNIQPYQNTNTFVISNQGEILEHYNQSKVGQIINDNNSGFITEANLKNTLNNGNTNIIKTKNESGEAIYFANSPIPINETSLKVSLGLTTPIREIVFQNATTIIAMIVIAIIGLVIMPLFGWFLGLGISKRLARTNKTLETLSQGNLKETKNLTIQAFDEIGELNTSINKIIDGLNTASNFAFEMGEGKLNSAFATLSDADTLGDALVLMQQSLQNAEKEESERKDKDEKINWASQGLAKFGETLRSNAQDIEKLSYEIVSNLINYLDVNQGAMFVVNKEDETNIRLNLTAAVAYGRQKFMQKDTSIKHGITGRCAFEKKTIYMTQVPEDYIEITSGLGTANPSALLLIPLILNDEVFGVLELASFHPFEKHHIEFVEKLGESIASTIATVNTNETTTKLLSQSKIQSEELAAQEEEMRQNLEELQATQEEASRREYEMEGVIKALGNTAFTVEYDLNGDVISANKKYAELLNEPLENLIGTNHAAGYDFNNSQHLNYNQFWSDLKQGKTIEQNSKLNIKGKEIWIKETYTPIFERESSQPYKVLKIGFDISEQYSTGNNDNTTSVDENKFNTEIENYKQKISALEKTIAEIPTTSKEVIKDSSDIIETYEPASIEAVDTNEHFKWSASLELGIEEIDQQHKQLFDLALQLRDSIDAKKTKKELKENLRSLIDFSSYHFGNEESYFEAFSYEGTEIHKEEHASFIKELASKQKEYQANKIKNLQAVSDYINTWVVNHFSSMDMLYKSVFKENGL